MFFLLVVRMLEGLSVPDCTTRRDMGLVNAQHGALFGTDFINNRTGPRGPRAGPGPEHA